MQLDAEDKFEDRVKLWTLVLAVLNRCVLLPES
jgi:hypothetical protein